MGGKVMSQVKDVSFYFLLGIERGEPFYKRSGFSFRNIGKESK